MNRLALYILSGLLVVLIFGTLMVPRLYDPVTLRNQTEKSRNLALSWLLENFTPQTGLFTYSLNPETGEFSLSQNALRQLMASRILAEESSTSEEVLGEHRVNLEYVMTDWYQEDENGGFVLFDEKSKLGANAMLLRTLVASPLFNDYSDEAEAVARGILHLQRDDGSFRAWYVEPSYKYDEAYILTFYSGEALLALVEYYEKTGDEQYLEAAKLSADFYIHEYVTNLEENYYPAYVPWHSLALNKLFKVAADAKYADAIFTMTDKLLEIQDEDLVVGRFYNPETPQYGSPHVSSDAVYTEGLAYAYEIAQLFGDTERSKQYKKALWLGARNLLSLQYIEENGEYPLPVYTYLGGFRTNLTNPYVRVDNVQHSIDAFTKILSLDI